MSQDNYEFYDYPIPEKIEKIGLPEEGYYEKLIEIILKAKEEKKRVFLGVFDEVEEEKEVETSKKDKET